jgi:hypothetical protein
MNQDEMIILTLTLMRDGTLHLKTDSKSEIDKALVSTLMLGMYQRASGVILHNEKVQIEPVQHSTLPEILPGESVDDFIRRKCSELSKMNRSPRPPCSRDPRAPHGFDRDASLSNDRYTCECESWQP